MTHCHMVASALARCLDQMLDKRQRVPGMRTCSTQTVKAVVVIHEAQAGVAGASSASHCQATATQVTIPMTYVLIDNAVGLSKFVGSTGDRRERLRDDLGTSWNLQYWKFSSLCRRA